MGGSAIGGVLARAALGDHASRPILAARSYGLPPWTTPDTTVLCASYSGDTEETLACYEAAGALGARRVVVTTGGQLATPARADGVPVIPLPGGFQPRGAVAYMLVSALEVAALCGAGPRMAAEIDVAAAHTERADPEWGPDAPDDSLAKTMARALEGTIPVIAGVGPDRPDRLPLEDADQRERQAAGVLRTSCPSSTTTSSSAGGRGAGRRLQRRVPRRLRHPPAGQGQRITLTQEAVAGRAPHLPRRDPRGDDGRAAGLARPARRPRLALHGHPPRPRPVAGAGDRRVQAGVRQARLATRRPSSSGPPEP